VVCEEERAREFEITPNKGLQPRERGKGSPFLPTHGMVQNRHEKFGGGDETERHYGKEG